MLNFLKPINVDRSRSAQNRTARDLLPTIKFRIMEPIVGFCFLQNDAVSAHAAGSPARPCLNSL